MSSAILVKYVLNMVATCSGSVQTLFPCNNITWSFLELVLSDINDFTVSKKAYPFLLLLRLELH